MKNKLIFLFSLIIITSCTPVYKFIDKTDRPSEVISDSLAVKYDISTNSFKEAIVGIYPPIEIDLKPGQIYKLEPDQPIKLKFNLIDFSVYTLFSRYNEEDKVVELGLVRTAAHKIELLKQCETIRWMDPYYIPKIEVSDQLKVQQIVITPIMDDNCEKKGYEIRYGSQQGGGCKNEAAEVFNRYIKCVKNPKPTTQRVSVLDVIVG